MNGSEDSSTIRPTAARFEGAQRASWVVAVEAVAVNSRGKQSFSLGRVVVPAMEAKESVVTLLWEWRLCR